MQQQEHEAPAFQPDIITEIESKTNIMIYRSFSTTHWIGSPDDAPEKYNEDYDHYFTPTQDEVNELLNKIVDECWIRDTTDYSCIEEAITKEVDYFIQQNCHNFTPKYTPHSRYELVHDLRTLSLPQLQTRLASEYGKRKQDYFTIQICEKLLSKFDKAVLAVQEDVKNIEQYDKMSDYFQTKHSDTFFDSVMRSFWFWTGKKFSIESERDIASMIFKFQVATGYGVERKSLVYGTRIADQTTRDWAYNRNTNADTKKEMKTDNTKKLNVKNGVLDLMTGNLEEHNPAYMFTCISPVTYNKDATCPTWEKLIDDMCYDEEKQAVDQEKVRALQVMCGYLLTGETSSQAMFILLGEAGAGKSTLTSALYGILGGEFCSALSVDYICTNTFSGGDLFGKRLNICEEVKDNYLETSGLKSLISGQQQNANKKNKDAFTYEPELKIVLNCNRMPNLTEYNDSIRRRFFVIKFNNSFTKVKGKRDVNMKYKLAEEYAGILNWCVEGLRMWQIDKGRIEETAEGKLIMDGFIEEGNPVACFLRDNFVKSDTAGGSISFKDFCTAFHGYAKNEKSGGRSNKTIKANLFELKLHIVKDSTSGGRYIIKGVRPRDEVEYNVLMLDANKF